MLRPTSMLAALAVAAATKHYGIVFDAGSSGTRIHVYTWQTGGGGPKDAFDLLSDDLLKIKPGLSAYKDKPSEAGASLAPLMEFAKTKIPASEVARTPMFLMATAGLRMVGEAAKDAILASVCSYLSSTGYLFRCGWATLLDGRDEGLYGWVTVNYLLNALYPGGQEASGIIDLGGGSVQIVFPTTIPSPPTSPAVAALTQTLDFNGRQHPIYVKSHLGYGLDAARNAVLDLLVSKGKDPAVHPCLPKGATATHKGVALTGSGDHHKCKKLVKRIFHDDDCVYGKHLCSINGVYQPQLPKSFYGFSYMYDRTKAIGLLDGKPEVYGSASMSRDDIENAAKATCALDLAATTAKFVGFQDAPKSANFCGDAVYLEVLLNELGFEDDASLTMTNKINGVELVWTLGAMLAKSAELAGGGGKGGSGAAGGGPSMGMMAGGLTALACLWYFCCGPGAKPAGPIKLYNADAKAGTFPAP